jgi:tight adherence protein C
MSMFTGLLLGAGLVIVNLLITETLQPTGLLAGFIVGTALSLIQLYSRASTRVRTIGKKVPYALDLIALAMGAGATFAEAVRTVARENKSDPFNVELNAMLAEIDLGATRRVALQNLADRVPLDSLRSIVASVIQAEELGTPLGEVLHQQASLLRLHRSVRAENAAAVASVRILVPSLLILIAVVIAIFGPAILRIVERGLF